MKGIKKLSYLFFMALMGCQQIPPTDTASLCMYQAVKSDRILLNRHNVRIGSVAVGYQSKETVCRSKIDWEDRADDIHEAGSLRGRGQRNADSERQLRYQRLNDCMRDPNVEAVNASSPAPVVAPAFRYFERMSSGLRLIDLESCPADFKVLFKEYITAWDKKLLLAQQNPNITINNWSDVQQSKVPENYLQKQLIEEDKKLEIVFKKVQNLVCDKTNYMVHSNGVNSYACR
jgi:hypothetical protein